MALINNEELTNQKIFEVYEAAYMSPTMDEDGEIKLDVDGTRMRARKLGDRPFFVLSASWTVKPGTTRQQVLELANRLNDHMILIRACVPDAWSEPGLYVDHYTMTTGGITGEEIVGVTRRFVSVVREGFAEHDSESIL